MTTGFALACMLWVGIRAYSAGSDQTFTPQMENLSPGVELAWSQAGSSPFVGLGDVKINIEAYNKKREKDIADASVKLLSLAIALKSEVEKDPGTQASPNTVRKAKEIEKLAHDVKEMMKINMVGPQ